MPSPSYASRNGPSRNGPSPNGRPRIAVLADIHGNLPALAAVLADLDRQGVDEVLVGGDLVGRGPQGSAVVARIRERGWPSVRGNHEDYLLAFRRGRVDPDWLVSEQWAASRFMAAELSDRDEAFLDSLPFTLAATGEPGLRLVHGSPRATDDGLGPWSSDRELSRHLATIGEDLLVCCHTHRPMLRRLPEGTVVNVGAVGLPFNRDHRAQYAIFERDGRRGESGAWQVEFRQVPYDLAAILSIYQSSGFLAAGGVTARLLALELRHATPYLVPFLKWAEVRDVEPRLEELPAFERFYRPEEPLQDFFRRLGELSEARP